MIDQNIKEVMKHARQKRRQEDEAKLAAQHAWRKPAKEAKRAELNAEVTQRHAEYQEGRTKPVSKQLVRQIVTLERWIDRQVADKNKWVKSRTFIVRLSQLSTLHKQATAEIRKPLSLRKQSNTRSRNKRKRRKQLNELH